MIRSCTYVLIFIDTCSNLGVIKCWRGLETSLKVIGKKVQDESVTPTVKRPKKQIVLLSRYPLTSVLAKNLVEVDEDSESLGQHIQEMKDEMSKQKPQCSLLAPLMKSTYINHRNFILYRTVSVATIIDKYPALSQPAMICNRNLYAWFYFTFPDGAINLKQYYTKSLFVNQ